MLRSLVTKVVLLASAIAVVLWIGWPAPRVDPPAIQSERSVATPAAVPPPLASAPSAPAARVNLNRAGVEELEILPDVGPVLAARIVEWRRRHGRYRTVDDLRAVKGIGKTRLERLRPLVTVQP